jgi:hypothetical protein
MNNLATKGKITKLFSVQIIKLISLASLFSLAHQQSAKSLTFNFSYASETTYEQKVAFELAGKIWSQYLIDNATINIHVQMSKSKDLPNKVIGGAMPVFLTEQSYSGFRNSLYWDGTSVEDRIAYNSLESNFSWSAGTTAAIHEKSSQLSMTRANAKGLQLIDSNSSELDAIILMSDLSNSGLSWQYNYLSNTVGKNNLDFTSVVIHELGHVLGFTSGVDIVDATNWDNALIQEKSTTTFDMFRYARLNNFGYNSGIVKNTIHGFNSYFSIDRGKTSLGYFSTGKNKTPGKPWGLPGDGYQGSHWANDDNIGLMDPVLEKETRKSIGQLDLQALDVIGWNRASTTFSTLSSTTLQNLMSQSQNIANSKINFDRHVEINQILREWTWGKGGSTGTLGQTTNLAQFLGQEGFFSIGSLWETMEETEAVPTPEASTLNVVLGLGLLGIASFKMGKK